jgi:hypothetical protein
MLCIIFCNPPEIKFFSTYIIVCIVLFPDADDSKIVIMIFKIKSENPAEVMASVR